MFPLPDWLKRFLQRLTRGKGPRVFLQDAEMVIQIRKVAQQRGRSENDIFQEMIKAGMDSFAMHEDSLKRWNSLTPREQEVVALVCLGQRNYEIGDILFIAPETVKTHLQNIFDKFKLRSRKELRLTLQNWDFASWWAKHQP